LKNLMVVWLVTFFASAVAAQTVEHSADWPDWAYGQLSPYSEEDRVSPPCPEGAKPTDCAYQGQPLVDDGVKLSLPDTPLTFTAAEADYDYGPADWYPDDHPTMPDVVAHGKPEEGLRPCSLCHYPNGQGKMENGHVSGLPVAYFIQQLESFESGGRRSADVRKANTNEMAMIATGLSKEERQEVAEYYGSIKFHPMIRVVEAEEVPQVRTTLNGLMIPIPDAALMPLGQRIIEVPEHPERTEVMRDPRGGFITYVPPGSLAKGEELVTSGGAGKTIQCDLCHGEGQRGLGLIPPIAGRTASYIMRQLWDYKQGTRKNAIMDPVMAKLTAEDMLNISAYISSLEP
jgi:cytochrome c553